MSIFSLKCRRKTSAKWNGSTSGIWVWDMQKLSGATTEDTESDIANEMNQRWATRKHAQNTGGLVVARMASQHFQPPHEGPKRRKSGSKMS